MDRSGLNSCKKLNGISADEIDQRRQVHYQDCQTNDCQWDALWVGSQPAEGVSNRDHGIPMVRHQNPSAVAPRNLWKRSAVLGGNRRVLWLLLRALADGDASTGTCQLGKRCTTSSTVSVRPLAIAPSGWESNQTTAAPTTEGSFPFSAM